MAWETQLQDSANTPSRVGGAGFDRSSAGFCLKFALAMDKLEHRPSCYRDALRSTGIEQSRPFPLKGSFHLATPPAGALASPHTIESNLYSSGRPNHRASPQLLRASRYSSDADPRSWL
jgi:hypothetical protein